MPRRSSPGLLVVVTLALAAGCASPRFVEVNRETAVVALPSNTNTWPCYYRDKAAKMLQERFPGG